MTIPFRGDLTHEDAAEEIRLRYAEDLHGSRRVLLFLATIGIVVGVGTVPFGSSLGTTRMSLLAIGLSVLLVPMALALPMLFRLIVQSEIQRATVPPGTFTGDLSEEGVTLMVPDGGGLRGQWRGIRKVRASDRLLVLVLPKDMVALLPRSFFADDAAWSAAVELARTKCKR